MTATSTEIETVVDDLTAHEFEPPCELGTWTDYRERNHSCENSARWVMYRNPCCSRTVHPALACDQCKDSRMSGDGAVSCAGCGHIVAPARLAYSYIEPLGRK